MKKILFFLLIAVLLGTFTACTTAPEKPTVLEEVTWQELADQSAMEENSNRYVSFEAQFLGADVKALPLQALYAPIANVVLMNHTEVGQPYDEEVITSLDSFLIGLPPSKETDEFMANTPIGDTIKIVGTTEYVVAGFGSFKHLLVHVESYEDISQ